MRKVNLVTRLAAGMAAAVLGVALAVPAAHAEEGKQLYEKNCLSCHGATGKGDGPAGKFLKPPPADFATALKGKADADLAKTIKEGGGAVGKSAMMPAFSGKLSDDQVQKVIEYIKGLGSN